MSEYQYYEWVAVDRQLSRDEMGYLRGISSRAQISPTRFCNTYNFGNLKADPRQLLSRFFDAYVYVSNFGCQVFAIKVPRNLISESLLIRYLVSDTCHYTGEAGHWIIEFAYENEDGYDDEWDEGDGWMGSLLNIRSELMHGDYRSLYLAWLSQLDELESGALSPAIPPGLDDLSASQSALCDFLKLDTQLVVASAQVKPDYASIHREALIDEYVKQLSAATAKTQLKGLLLDETGTVRREQLSTLIAQVQEVPQSSSVTVGRLLASARELQKKAHKEAVEQKRLQQQKRAQNVAANEDAYWRQVEALFETRGSYKVYSELSTKLGELQLMSKMLDRQTAYDQKLAELKQRYAKKTSHWQGGVKASINIWNDLMTEMTAAMLRHAAMNLLAQREYSRKELFRKLGHLSQDSELIDEVLNWLESDRLLSDDRFVEGFVRSRIQKGHGPMRIAQDLRQKGVASEVISLALEAAEADWYELADNARKKKFGEASPFRCKGKGSANSLSAIPGFSCRCGNGVVLAQVADN